MGASPTASDWLIVSIIAGGGVLGASLLMWLLYRVVARDAARATERLLASPWNNAASVDHGRVRIGAVIATDDEMLVELQWVCPSRSSDSITWLTGPLSVGAIITLSRWHDAQAVVRIVPMADRILLHNEQARVCFRAVPAPNIAA